MAPLPSKIVIEQVLNGRGWAEVRRFTNPKSWAFKPDRRKKYLRELESFKTPDGGDHIFKPHRFVVGEITWQSPEPNPWTE